jgi:sugar/nucleoside kinase (ribokinase family)
MVKVIGIGDNVCDKYVHSGIMYPGGQALNFSVYAKQLGADSSYMGVWGRDAVAEHVIKTLDELGIEHSRSRQYDGENGYAMVKIADGDRIFLHSNKGGVAKSHPIALTDEDLDYIRAFQLIHTSNNGNFDGQLPSVCPLGIPISYDFSGQWKDPALVKKVAPYVTYGFLSCGSLSEEEAHQICRKMKEDGCHMVIATRGGAGALVYDGKQFYEEKPDLVDAVDTLGAGDSFATAFLLSMIENDAKGFAITATSEVLYEERIRSAIKAGNRFSARICMVNGAFGHGVPYTD